jgi:FkbM family methyltransferase
MRLERLREMAERFVVLRSVMNSSGARSVVRTVRASRALREPLRFTLLQLGSRRTVAYRLRGSGLTIYLRHQTRDIDIFKEIFGPGYGPNSYEPPGALAAALDAKDSIAVLDLGGNIGLFGAYVVGRWPRATLRSFEPDPTNLPLLNGVVAVNGLRARWSVAELAVANSPGELPFVSGLFAESQLVGMAAPPVREAGAARVEDGKPIMVGVVDLFEQDHDVDLMKMDIEGGEWSILTDPRLQSLQADAIVLEWHASGCPVPDPRATAIRLLRAAGYGEIEESESFAQRGLLWAWREAPARGASLE